jgi:transcription elongation factor Elf1
MKTPEPTFLFFRSHPKESETCIALASSMQSFDSVLLLVALTRYPHALITCAAARESVIKSSAAGKGRSNGLNDLLQAARRESNELAAFPEDSLAEFRKARNRITHDGFSPRDDSESVGLLLEVGLPFLHQCYLHLFSFDLWDALLPDYVEQFRIGTEVYLRAKGVADLDRSYCLKGLGHLIRWSLKDSFSADWEIDELVKAEESGMGVEFKYKQRQQLEHLFSPNWVFDCPLCDEPAAVVCQLDVDALDSRDIIPIRLACTNCGLVVGKADRYLSEALLKEVVSKEKVAILKEYGL